MHIQEQNNDKILFIPRNRYAYPLNISFYSNRNKNLWKQKIYKKYRVIYLIQKAETKYKRLSYS
jgi:hypothetical protein